MCKKNMCFSIVAVCCIAMFYSCQKEELPVLRVEEAIIFPEDHSLTPTVSSSGVSTIFNFKTIEPWSITSSSPKSDDWHTISPLEGEAGEATIVITAEPNDTYSDRTVTISIESAGLKREIVLTQNQLNFLGIEGDDLSKIMGVEGGVLEVTLNTNVDFEIEYQNQTGEPITWIELQESTKTKNLESKVLKFNVLNSTETKDRIGEIIFTSGDQSVAVTVTQGQLDSFGVDPNDLTHAIGALEESFEVSVKTNVDFDIKYQNEAGAQITWIKQVVSPSSKGIAPTILKFVSEANEQMDERVGNVIISDGIIEETITVTQSRAGSTSLSIEIEAYKIRSIDAQYALSPEATYQWSVGKVPAVTSPAVPIYSLTNADEEIPMFLAGTRGVYHLRIEADDNGESYSCDVRVTVTDPQTVPTKGVSKVFDFMPAPGQHINQGSTQGRTKEQMMASLNQMCDAYNNVSAGLGGFGGYITFGFDHTIVNVKGKRDIRTKGNAFYADTPNPTPPGRSGWLEPGIIMVAYDANENGVPDENEWYEIAGSEYYKTATIKNYEITYYRPESEEANYEGDQSHIAIEKYLRWSDNQGGSGYKIKNTFYSQSYYPDWITEDEITFRGTKLADNGVNEGAIYGSSEYWVQYAYGYGYVDNVLNTEDDSAFDISWAVDANGNKVELPGVDFMKVYTGVNQECGWLGETSTDFMGTTDMHLTGDVISSIVE